jgi:hypothetical protein
MVYIDCMDVKYVPADDNARIKTPLRGAFLSCLVDGSDNAVMGYWGSQLSEQHRSGIETCLQDNKFGNVVKATILYLRKEDQGELVISSEKYEQLAEEFQGIVSEISGVEAELVPYKNNVVVCLNPNRELIVR